MYNLPKILFVLCVVVCSVSLYGEDDIHDMDGYLLGYRHQDELNELLEKPIKKIFIVESNNMYAHARFRKLLLPTTLNEPVLVELKKYVVSKQPTFAGMSDTALMKSVAGWMASTIRHDGREYTRKSTSLIEMLDSYFDGSTKIRCQDISQLYANIMISFGNVARIVYVNTKNSDYGTIGSGHVLTEVWSNTLNKWVMIDPQFGVTASANGSHLNYYEFVYALKNTPDKLVVTSLQERYKNLSKISQSQTAESYLKFIQPYNGTMYVQMQQTSGSNLMYKMILSLDETIKHYMTFQGLPLDNAMFTNHYDDLYFDLNRVMLFFSYPYDVNWSIFQNDTINTTGGYTNAMPEFVAKPNYKIHFESTMPWLKYIKCRINSSTNQTIKPGRDIAVKLKSGVNIIEAIPINEADTEGIKTKIKIFYGTDVEYDKYINSVSKGD
jgi:hypothetical protein